MNTGRDRDESVERLIQRSLSAGDFPVAGDCPDAETFAAWMEGGLGQHEMALVEAHASECARCQALMAAMVQAVPERSLTPALETWRSSWGLRWLVPLAASAAAAVILWIAVPNDRRPDRADQASSQSPSASPATPRQEAEADRLNAPAVGLEQPAIANGTPSARSADKDANIGASEREQRQKQDARAEVQPSPELLDKVGPQAQTAPLEAAGQAKSSVNATAALSRTLRAPFEIISPDPSVRWRIGGDLSVLEHTTNGGTTWEAASIGARADLTAGASPSPSVCWLVGRGGVVLLSTDGRTWRRMPFPEMTDLTAVQAEDARTATVSTADARKFRTTDGGLTWN